MFPNSGQCEKFLDVTPGNDVGKEVVSFSENFYLLFVQADTRSHPVTMRVKATGYRECGQKSQLCWFPSLCLCVSAPALDCLFMEILLHKKDALLTGFYLFSQGSVFVF